MKAVMLLENLSADSRLEAEHGLSLYLETGDHRILFDTGQTDAFARNAEKLGIDLRAVDMAVLSHGHYDHSGGLARFLAINDHAPVYIHREAFERRKAADGREIGIRSLPESEGRIVLTGDSLELRQDLRLCTCNGATAPYASHSAGLLMFREGCFVPDDFHHEQYLCIREQGKLIVVSGCSHKGVLNILHWLRPDVLIGGFHFMSLDAEGEGSAELDRAAETLAACPTVCCTCHCTGKKQFDYLKPKLGDRLHYLSAGMGLIVDENGVRVTGP